jgi:polysaccharide pyruvyl transferase CsaB
MSSKQERDLVVISGYYGFGNLGDEAILEEIIDEVKQLVPLEKIYVLSNNPQNTSRSFGVRAVSRWKLKALIELLPSTKLFISGGGGLFQDITSAKPPIFYGFQIAMARLMGAKVMIFAQGLGPLRSFASIGVTRGAMALANVITVRDQDSHSLLQSWGIKAELTADPVWRLQPGTLPATVADQFKLLTGANTKEKSFLPYGSEENRERVENELREKPNLLVGLSLRESKNFSQEQMETLASSLHKHLPESAQLLLLPLQKEQDLPELERFEKLWQKYGRKATFINPVHLSKPSEWLSLFSRLDVLVGMRLHAVIMSLKSKVPVIGLAYDHKVSYVLSQFEQPILNLQQEAGNNEHSSWEDIIETAIADRSALARRASEKAEVAKNLSGQNFAVLSRILDMQSAP